MSLSSNNTINDTSHTRKCMTRNGKIRSFTVIFDSNGKPQIPAFNNVQVSTMTVIAYTNLIIDTDLFFKYMPTTDWTMIKKKRGRKKKVQPEDPNIHIPPGSIITLTKKRCIRGVILRPKRKMSKTFFRHSVPVVMVLDDGKMLNVKVSRNGKLQMTGCKTIKHAVDFIKYIYSYMIEAEEWTGEVLFTYKTDNDDLGDVANDSLNEGTNYSQDPQDIDESEPKLERQSINGLNVVFRCVMKNLDFDIGYRIRRDLLNTYINRFTDFRSIFESSIGTSVNIKIKTVNRCDPKLTRLRITAEGECIEDLIDYQDFYDTLSTKDKKLDSKKEAYHTFLIFASGSIIMSSAGGDMPHIFNKLVTLLVDNRKHIEEIDSNTVIDMSWLDDPVVCL
jgi:hypothetical protein